MPKVIEPKTTYINDRQVPLDELQKMVGGLIQLVNVQTDDGETHIIMDEEGKNKNKPIQKSNLKNSSLLLFICLIIFEFS